VSLNHKRRIFRSSFARWRLAAGWMAAPGAVLTVLLGATVAGLALWPEQDPPVPATRSTATERIVTDATRVAVVDASTLRLAERVVRLDGIIPPARGETCTRHDGAPIDCGAAAANALAAMLGHGPVDCTWQGVDRDGRPVATCSAGGAQLNRAVVAAGWARAEDHTLRAVEQRARANHLGLWAASR
jgi:endonuclease YncB( thermonuclease family)